MGAWDLESADAVGKEYIHRLDQQENRSPGFSREGKSESLRAWRADHELRACKTQMCITYTPAQCADAGDLLEEMSSCPRFCGRELKAG